MHCCRVSNCCPATADNFMSHKKLSYRRVFRDGASAVIMPFKVIQGHRFWYQSKARMQLPILTNMIHLASYARYRAVLIKLSLLIGGASLWRIHSQKSLQISPNIAKNYRIWTTFTAQLYLRATFT